MLLGLALLVAATYFSLDDRPAVMPAASLSAPAAIDASAS